MAAKVKRAQSIDLTEFLSIGAVMLHQNEQAKATTGGSLRANNDSDLTVCRHFGSNGSGDKSGRLLLLAF